MRNVLLAINRYFHYISCIFLMALMTITVVDIVGRALFTFRLRGIYELTGIFLLIVVYFSFGKAESNKDNVVIDFFSKVYFRFIPPIMQKAVLVLKQLIYLAIVGVMAWRILVYGIYMMGTGAMTASLNIPNWPVILLTFVAIIGFILVLISDLFYPQPEGGEIKIDAD